MNFVGAAIQRRIEPYCFREETMDSILLLKKIGLLLLQKISRAGVISMGGSGERSPLVKTFDHFGGLNPLKILAWALLFKVY